MSTFTINNTDRILIKSKWKFAVRKHYAYLLVFNFKVYFKLSWLTAASTGIFLKIHQRTGNWIYSRLSMFRLAGTNVSCTHSLSYTESDHTGRGVCRPHKKCWKVYGDTKLTMSFEVSTFTFDFILFVPYTFWRNI